MSALLKAVLVAGIGYLIFADPTPSVAISGGNCTTVQVSAYNSLANQTDSTPNIAAWGYRLSARDKWRVAAVSPNMLRMFGKGAKVRLEGIGTVTIVDKTNSRLHNVIDIYAHKSKTDADNFGRKHNIRACAE
jgi:3D (Asp-Asp-Asp) domain-containing protein